MRANVIELAQASDVAEFKEKVFKFIGDLTDYHVIGDKVLIATYVPPEKTKGGIIRPNAKVGEVRFSGCAHLVLKLGESAFKYDGAFEYQGIKPQPGDFVQCQPGNAREFFLGPKGAIASHDHGVSCRLMPSSLIEAIVDDPERVAQGNGFENL
jgi:hypothetical protein